MRGKEKVCVTSQSMIVDKKERGKRRSNESLNNVAEIDQSSFKKRKGKRLHDATAHACNHQD